MEWYLDESNGDWYYWDYDSQQWVLYEGMRVMLILFISSVSKSPQQFCQPVLLQSEDKFYNRNVLYSLSLA